MLIHPPSLGLLRTRLNFYLLQKKVRKLDGQGLGYILLIEWEVCYSLASFSFRPLLLACTLFKASQILEVGLSKGHSHP